MDFIKKGLGTNMLVPLWGLLVFIAACGGKEGNNEARDSTRNHVTHIDSPDVIWSETVTPILQLECRCEAGVMSFVLRSTSFAGETTKTVRISAGCAEKSNDRILLIQDNGISRKSCAKVSDSLYLVPWNDGQSAFMAFLQISSDGPELAASLPSHFGFFIVNLEKRYVLTTSRLDLRNPSESEAPTIPVHLYQMVGESFVYKNTYYALDSAFTPTIVPFTEVPNKFYNDLYTKAIKAQETK